MNMKAIYWEVIFILILFDFVHSPYAVVQLCGNVLIANHEELDHDNHQHGNPKQEEIELVQD